MVRIPQSVKIVGAVIGMTNAVVLTPSIYQFVLNHPYWERRRSSRAVYERAAERAREVLFAHLVERNARGEILP